MDSSTTDNRVGWGPVERENAEAQSAPAWRVIGASATGTSHQRTQTPCQDAFDLRFWEQGVIVAVADGAGSARWAKEGAHLAVQSGLNQAEALLATEIPNATAEDAWQKLLYATFETARTTVCQHAESVYEEPRAFASTLLLAIFTAEATYCGLIGDCAIVIQTSPDETGATELVSLCPAQKGEFANMTNFLTQPDAMEVLDFQTHLAPIQNAAMLTDGLLEIALNLAENRPHKPFFEPFFAFAAATESAPAGTTSLAKFLQTERVNQRTADDKTLLLVHRLLKTSSGREP